MPRTDEQLLARAKQMRANPTPTETAMWPILRAKRFEHVKFARQVGIAPYIADFVARSRKLVVEIDGDTHALCEAKDARRTAWLEHQGYRVIRFTNYEVGSNLDGGAAVIAAPLVDTAPLPNQRRVGHAPGMAWTARGAVHPALPGGERA